MSEPYSIRHELTAKHFDQLCCLVQQTWWGVDRTKEEMSTLLKNSLPFAVIDTSSQELIGFARVLTDEARYAYIYDVMAQEPLRGQGIGKMIMQAILDHPKLSKVKYFELTCKPDMIEYYNKFGFSEDYKTVVAMRLQK